MAPARTTLLTRRVDSWLTSGLDQQTAVEVAIWGLQAHAKPCRFFLDLVMPSLQEHLSLGRPRLEQNGHQEMWSRGETPGVSPAEVPVTVSTNWPCVMSCLGRPALLSLQRTCSPADP